MAKKLSVDSIANIDMESGFELNVFATQNFNKITESFETNSFRGDDYEVPFSAQGLVPGHFIYEPEAGGQLDVAGKFIDSGFNRQTVGTMGFGDGLKNDRNGTVKLFLLSWDKKYLIVVDKFHIIKWRDGTNGPDTSIMTHSFRLVKVPGKIDELYKRSQLRIDNLSQFMNWRRFSVDGAYHTKEEENGMLSFRVYPEDDIKMKFRRVHTTNRYYCVFEGEPLKIEIKSTTVGKFGGMHRIHPQEINVKFETYLQVVSMKNNKQPLFYDRVGREFATLLSILMMTNLKLRQNMLGANVPSVGLRPVQNFNAQNFKGYDIKEKVSVYAIQFGQIPDFQELLSTWSTNEKLRVLAITLVNVWDENLSVSVRLKELVAAIEIYYRDESKTVVTKNGKEQFKQLSAKEAVEKLINEISDNEKMTRIIGDVEAFAKKLVDYRVLFTHGTRKAGIPEDANESDVLTETINLEFLIRTFILYHLNINSDRIISILGRQWLE